MDGESVLEELRLQVDAPHVGLDDRDLVLDVDVDDLAHALEIQDDHPIPRSRADRVESGRERLCHQIGAIAEAQDLAHLLRRLGKHDGDGTGGLASAVSYVRLRVHVEGVGIHHAGLGGNPAGTDDLL